MDWQLTGVGLVIGAASAYLLRSTIKTWFGKSGGGCGSCGSGCEKPSDAPSAPRVIPRNRITVVRR